jgi:Big-like domain-containing protein
VRHVFRATAALAAAILCSVGAGAQSLPAMGVRAVTTYESAGLYWTNPGANATTGCDVRYRKAGESTWSTGLALWFDAASNECRGSVVGLTPGTNYEAQLGTGGAMTRAINFTTWTNLIPVARTVNVPAGSGSYNVTEGGSASGYVVYDGAGAVRDVQNGAANNITIDASYVVVRNLTLRGAQRHAILISPSVHDVVIEDNDVSGWGRTRDGTWGTDMDSGVRAICSAETLTRVTIQRNRIHDPRYGANSWTDGHPAGPQAITFSYCGGNHVFRWNEIYSTNGNRFNDGMGGEDNFSTVGFPNNDSDIYGNTITHAWDDGIEAEGANRNVRIWGNYLDRTATGIATTVSSVGPVYIFRNVFNRNQFYDKRAADQDDRQPFFKSGSSSDFGNGRRYLFHNTMLQATQAGSSHGLGGGAGVGGTGNSQLVRNTVSMNNIYHLWKPNSAVYQVGSDNAFQNDMYNGSMGTAVVGGINATPQYAAGHGWQSEAGGRYQLAAGTPGHDGGVRIANFNDGFLGSAPDVGASEAGAAAMAFGLAASTGSSGGTATPVIPTTPTTPTTPTAPVKPGTAPASMGMDSSSYRIDAGASVTFTATLSGSSGTPTGTLDFRSNGVTIAGCGAIAISGGSARCTTTGLASGSHAIAGLYSGDATYSAGLAGPITQTVTSTSATSSTSDSVNVQGLWWGSASESGWGLNLAQQGNIVFATWFTYDAAGNGQWLVMSNGTKTGSNAYAGTLYRTTGPAFDAATFDPSRVVATAVGTASLSFGDANNGTFTATVDGATVTKAITRQVYAQLPTCTAGGSAAASSNYQDLWWRPDGVESGWGLNITHQADVLFMTWFTYDAAGKGLWLVASDLTKTGPQGASRGAGPQGASRGAGEGTYSGALYRTTGPAFNAPKWDAARVSVTPVGSVSLAFSDGGNGVFSYTVNGVSQSKPITRQVFSSPATVCR